MHHTLEMLRLRSMEGEEKIRNISALGSPLGQAAAEVGGAAELERGGGGEEQEGDVMKTGVEGGFEMDLSGIGVLVGVEEAWRGRKMAENFDFDGGVDFFSGEGVREKVTGSDGDDWVCWETNVFVFFILT